MADVLDFFDDLDDADEEDDEDEDEEEVEEEDEEHDEDEHDDDSPSVATVVAGDVEPPVSLSSAPADIVSEDIFADALDDCISIDDGCHDNDADADGAVAMMPDDCNAIFASSSKFTKLMLLL